jgi:DNA-packaging protein gp3
MKNFGRPSKYRPIYCKKIIKYFNIDPTITKLEKFYYKNGDVKEKEVEVAANLPTIVGFAQSIGVYDTTLVRWTAKHADFRTAYNWAKKLQETIWMSNASKGLYNPLFSIFLGKNIFGYKDKSETEHSGNVTWTEEKPK